MKAIAQYKRNRKFLSTGITIHRDQVPFLDSIGEIDREPMTEEDIRVNAQIAEYTKYAYQVAVPLVKSGKYDTMTGPTLSAAIAHAMQQDKKSKEEASHGE